MLSCLLSIMEGSFHYALSSPAASAPQYEPMDNTAVVIDVDKLETPVSKPENPVSEPVLTAAASASNIPRVQSFCRSAELDDFDCSRTLGTGYFGRVVLAKHKNTGKYHAMKVLKRDRMIQLKQTKRVQTEKKVLMSVELPFIVELNYSFKDNCNLYFVFEFVNGGDLYTYLRRMGYASEEECLFIAAQLVLCLEYLHTCGIAHRDIKPENILIDDLGYLKLTDFGLAKPLPLGCRTFSRCGTMEYWAPEVVRGTGYGKAVDWWSLGVCLYEASSGMAPFAGDTKEQIFNNILAGRVRYPRYISLTMRDAVSKLLKMDERARHGHETSGCQFNIRDHAWFSKIDWEVLYERQYKSPLQIEAPEHPGDTRNFIEFDEDPNLFSDSSEELFEEQFAGF